MAARQLTFREETRARIKRGVGTQADAGKVPLGPRGRTVILERDFGARRRAMRGRIAAIRKEEATSGNDCGREKLDGRAAELSGGVALLRARRVLDDIKGAHPDHASGSGNGHDVDRHAVSTPYV